MIQMRLLEGDDYQKDYHSDYASCINFCVTDCGDEREGQKQERGQFFHHLWSLRKGGILVAETEEGDVAGWFSFVDKAHARQMLWPSRRDHDDLNRLVGVCLFVEPEKRGLSIGMQLAEELKELSREWGYNGVEVACRESESDDPKLTWHTPAPFRKAGYQEVEHFHCDLVYPADFLIMEYIW